MRAVPGAISYPDLISPPWHCAAYRSSGRVVITGFLRLSHALLFDELQSEAGEVLATGSQSLLTVCSVPGPQGLYVTPGVPTQMVVLYCRPEVLT
jgi:hypothetical protein